MADKDFAQSETTSFDSNKDTPVSNSKAAVIAVLALMFAIVCFAVGFFMGEKYGIESTQGTKQETLLQTLKEQQKEIASFKKEAKKWQQKEAATSQVGELTFYNELPNQSVMPEPINAHDVVKTAAPESDQIISDNIVTTEKKLNAIIAKEMNTSTRKFRIQLASFIQRKDADNLVAQLKEVGVVAKAERVDLVNLGTRYRVNTLPFDQHEHALRAKKMVKEKFGITGIIISK